MAVFDKLRRLLKLGLFVGAGSAVALVAACSSAVKRLDTGAQPPDGSPRDVGVVDARKQDAAGLRDGAHKDAGPRDLGQRDKRRWDIPLE